MLFVTIGGYIAHHWQLTIGSFSRKKKFVPKEKKQEISQQNMSFPSFTTSCSQKNIDCINGQLCRQTSGPNPR